MNHSVQTILGEDGLLVQADEGCQYRAPQAEMAERIEAGIKDNQVLLMEAATGVGKTFAYLVPVLLQTEKKALISTATRALQDQLFYRDIERLKNLLGSQKKVACLKGRANYVCLHYLSRNLEMAREDSLTLLKIQSWAEQSQEGDRSECPVVSEDDMVWQQAISTEENCLGTQCSYHRSCFLLKARRNALAADVVVVNHHLLLTDLGEGNHSKIGFLERFPVVIVDEAHRFPGLASFFFSERLGSSELLELVRYLRQEALGMATIHQICQQVESQVLKWLEIIMTFPGGQRMSYQALQKGPAMFETLQEVATKLDSLQSSTLTLVGKSEELDQWLQRLESMRQFLRKWLVYLYDSQNCLSCWMEKIGGRAVFFVITPLDCAGRVGQLIGQEQDQSWIFSSATLTTSGGFNYFKSALGLDISDLAQRVQAQSWPSPFRYEQQALFYLPEQLAAPQSEQHLNEFIDSLFPIIKCLQGKALILFTTWQNLQRGGEYLRACCDDEDLPISVLCQGEQAKAVLLSRFIEGPSTVLLGTQSFWEGIDIPGSALSLLAIDRLPFTVPDDPLVQLSLEASKQQGKPPFAAVQLPQMILHLKQGVGRLIRGIHDFGVLVIGDIRLKQRRYGWEVVQQLPPMHRTQKLEDVISFCKTMILRVPQPEALESNQEEDA